MKNINTCNETNDNVVDRVGQKVSHNILHITYQILADFPNSFFVIISRKFAMRQSLNIPPSWLTLLACPVLVRYNLVHQL